jgi:hypothetical protein
LLSALNISHVHAADPTVSITTPSGVVKGQVVLTANPLADPAGTATLAKAGIKIAGLPSYSVTLSGHGTPDYSSLSFDAAGTADYAWNAGNGNYQFNFDTTPWPTGSYQVTAFTKDSNGRSAVSAPITITLAKSALLDITQVLGVGNQPAFEAKLIGASSLEGGNLFLSVSESKDGQFIQISEFKSANGKLAINGALPLGKWVRAELRNSPTIKDVNSQSIQVLGYPSVKCSFASATKIGTKVVGKCLSSIDLTSAPVQLQTNIGKGWVTVARGLMSGSSISPAVTPTQAGNLQVRLTSVGISGRTAAFSSNILSIQVSKK